MPSVAVQAIANTWRRQGEYAAKLVADLSATDMMRQPVQGVVMNHPAWVYSHLGVYTPVLRALLLGEPFADPITSPYGRDSSPKGDPTAYEPKSTLIPRFLSDHEALGETFSSIDESVLARPIPLERWKDRFPLIGDAVIYLMINHESVHLGQVSAWRRAGKRPPV